MDKIKNYFDNDQIIITDIDKNAYLSSLRLADHIVVTCDSTSMISEAAMTGKPIYVVQMPPVKKNERFQKFFRLFKSFAPSVLAKSSFILTSICPLDPEIPADDG